MKNLFILFLFCGVFQLTTVHAQGYNIRINVNSMAGKNVILANYFEGKVYACDTAKLDNQGNGFFRNNQKNWQGECISCCFLPVTISI